MELVVQLANEFVIEKADGSFEGPALIFTPMDSVGVKHAEKWKGELARLLERVVPNDASTMPEAFSKKAILFMTRLVFTDPIFHSQKGMIESTAYDRENFVMWTAPYLNFFGIDRFNTIANAMDKVTRRVESLTKPQVKKHLEDAGAVNIPTKVEEMKKMLVDAVRNGTFDGAGEHQLTEEMCEASLTDGELAEEIKKRVRDLKPEDLKGLLVLMSEAEQFTDFEGLDSLIQKVEEWGGDTTAKEKKKDTKTCEGLAKAMLKELLPKLKGNDHVSFMKLLSLYEHLWWTINNPAGPGGAGGEMLRRKLVGLCAEKEKRILGESDEEESDEEFVKRICGPNSPFKPETANALHSFFDHHFTELDLCMKPYYEIGKGNAKEWLDALLPQLLRLLHYGHPLLANQKLSFIDQVTHLHHNHPDVFNTMIEELLQTATDAIQELINSQLSHAVNTTSVRSPEYIKNKSLTVNVGAVLKQHFRSAQDYKQREAGGVRENEMDRRAKEMTDPRRNKACEELGAEIMRRLMNILQGQDTLRTLPINKELEGLRMLPDRLSKMQKVIDGKRKKKTETQAEVEVIVKEIDGKGGFVQFILPAEWSQKAERGLAYNSTHPTTPNAKIHLTNKHTHPDHELVLKALNEERKKEPNKTEPKQVTCKPTTGGQKKAGGRKKAGDQLQESDFKRLVAMESLKVNDVFMSAYTDENPDLTGFRFVVVKIDYDAIVYRLEHEKELWRSSKKMNCYVE